jgi:hypothetical protein
MDGWMDGWMGGWVGGWVGRLIYSLLDRMGLGYNLSIGLLAI